MCVTMYADYAKLWSVNKPAVSQQLLDALHPKCRLFDINGFDCEATLNSGRPSCIVNLLRTGASYVQGT
jgi:hypothetical protein